jgi:hypothetical protein
MYQDAAGTIPAANPMIGDGVGSIRFYAAPSLYVAELAGTLTRIPVDPSVMSPVWPNLYIHTQAVPATVWTVKHHFGVIPQANVVASGDDIEAAVSHLDAETTVITFGASSTGTAYLRR